MYYASHVLASLCLHTFLCLQSANGAAHQRLNGVDKVDTNDRCYCQLICFDILKSVYTCLLKNDANEYLYNLVEGLWTSYMVCGCICVNYITEALSI